MPTEQDLLDRAAEVMAKVVVPGASGPSGADDPVMHHFGDLIRVTVMGAVWARPGLDLKTRTLVCVVSDVASGRFAELPIHTRMALKQGWTREELIEVVLHLAAYCGAPAAREGMMGLKEAFEAEDAS